MSPAATRALPAAAALVTFCPTPSCGRCGKAAALEATRATLANDAPTHARPIPGFFALKAADGAAEALHAITPTPVGGLAAAGPRALRPSAISSKKLSSYCVVLLVVGTPIYRYPYGWRLCMYVCGTFYPTSMRACAPLSPPAPTIMLPRVTLD